MRPSLVHSCTMTSVCCCMTCMASWCGLIVGRSTSVASMRATVAVGMLGLDREDQQAGDAQRVVDDGHAAEARLAVLARRGFYPPDGEEVRVAVVMAAVQHVIGVQLPVVAQAHVRVEVPHGVRAED